MNQRLPSGAGTGLLARVGFALVFVMALGAGLVLSAAFFAVFMVLAVIGSIWLWWQRRRWRRQNPQTHSNNSSHDTIEGEFQVLNETHKHRQHANTHSNTDSDSDRF